MPRLRVTPPKLPLLAQWRLRIGAERAVPMEWTDVQPGDHDVELHVTAVGGNALISGTCRWTVTVSARSEVDISFPRWPLDEIVERVA